MGWCVGVLAYILLSGELPYPDAPDSFRQPKIVPFSGDAWTSISGHTKSWIASMLELQPLLRLSAREALQQLQSRFIEGDVEAAKAEMKAAFRGCDRQGDGTISKDGLGRILYALGEATVDLDAVYDA